MEDKDEDHCARCLERGQADARVKSSFVNLTMYFFYRWFTIIIYYIQTKYFIVQSVKKRIKDATHMAMLMKYSSL